MVLLLVYQEMQLNIVLMVMAIGKPYLQVRLPQVLIMVKPFHLEEIVQLLHQQVVLVVLVLLRLAKSVM